MAVLLFLVANSVQAKDGLAGYAGVECRLFAQKPLFRDQADQDASAVLSPEYYHEWSQDTRFTAIPFARIDSADPKRSHVDLRELDFVARRGAWTTRLGIGKVFWGTTEFAHLVDIVNQTDAVESISGEEKLGQPMAQVSVSGALGTVDAYLLPYFRERTFPGPEGRLRFGLPVDADAATYESRRKEWHPDLAVRYGVSAHGCDAGLSYFRGTSREPDLVPVLDENWEPELRPHYPQIEQAGADVACVAGPWLLKFEGVRVTGRSGGAYTATTGGVEYTFVRFLGSEMDLGLVAEAAYDSRSEQATTIYNHDVMFGVRLTVNDMDGTQLLVGVIKDVKLSTGIFKWEGSRRLGDRWKLALSGYVFSKVSEADVAYDFRRDSYASLELNYLF